MFVLPFDVLKRKLDLNDVQENAFRLIVTDLLLSRTDAFNNDGYLRDNPDVAAAMRRGECKEGRSHFATDGYYENRRDAAYGFSEDWYLGQYPDVADAVRRGEWRSAEQHYSEVGIHELRAPTRDHLEDLNRWKAALKVSEATDLAGR